MQISREQQLGPRWWQLKHFLFSPLTFGEDEPIFDEHMLNIGVGEEPPIRKIRTLGCWDLRNTLFF